MAGRHARILNRLGRLADPPADGPATDAALLDRFAASANPTAFTELVRRHGPMVLAVCRRVLRHEHDAEDAFQAAFLVLARKARSVRRRGSVGSWLFGVARHVALRLREKNHRRSDHERAAAAERPEAAPVDPSWQEVLAVLDEELAALPERYRVPLLVCHIQGRTQEDAARDLGWSLSTFRRRLDRGRQLLRARLARRTGMSAAGLFAVGVVHGTVTATVPAGLLDSTYQAAVAFTTGMKSAAPAVALAEGALTMMAQTKLVTVAGAVLLVAAVGGAGTLWGAAGGRSGGPDATGQQPNAAGPKTPAGAEPKKPDAVEPKKPEAAEKVLSVNFTEVPWEEVLDWYGKETGLTLVATTKPTGNVTIKPPGNRKFTLAEVTDLLNESLAPQKMRLIRLQATFTIWPLDEKIDPTLIPDITPQELTKRGRTEIIRCTVGPLKTLTAAEIKPLIEQLLTPGIGTVVPLDRLNSFQITDKAGNITRIIKTLEGAKALEEDKPKPPAKDNRLQPGDVIRIHAPYSLVTDPLKGVYRIGADGVVSMGTYGKAKVGGLTIPEAEAAIRKPLAELLRNPEVHVTRYEPAPREALETRIERLEDEVKELKRIVEELRSKK
jgi:RNA polymerase sigma factor (sigma-70 family)